MTPGTKARIPLREQPREVWTVVDVLPGGQVNLERKVKPWEIIWGGYRTPWKFTWQHGLKKVYCQVNSAKDLEVVE